MMPPIESRRLQLGRGPGVDLETALANLPHEQILGNAAALKAAIVAVIAVLPEWQRAAVLTRIDAVATAMRPGHAVQGTGHQNQDDRNYPMQEKVSDRQWFPGDPIPNYCRLEPKGHFRHDMHTRYPCNGHGAVGIATLRGGSLPESGRTAEDRPTPAQAVSVTIRPAASRMPAASKWQ